MGDYNAMLQVDDRINGADVQEQEIKDFKDFLIDTELTEIKTVGRQYTWTNNHIYSKIDRALVNVEWIVNWPHLEVMVLDPMFSDYSPYVLLSKIKQAYVVDFLNS